METVHSRQADINIAVNATYEEINIDKNVNTTVL